MKITYTATNRAHHYPYAKELYRLNCLHAFVSGFSRLSPRAAFPEIHDALKRRDLLQTLYVLSLKANAPSYASDALNVWSNKYLDWSSYRFACESDVFLYYRTTGKDAARRLKTGGAKVMCVLEEVNSHVSLCHSIMREEYLSLGVGGTPEKFPDMDDRLEAYDDADFILCPSEWVKRSFIQKGFDPNRILKNPYGFQNGMSVPEQPPAVANDGTFRILYVGQIHYRKGLRYLVEAFRQLKHSKKELVIVGPKTIVTGLENIALPSGIRFTGELKGEQLLNAYRTASIFCLPSLEEGLALVMGEALSFGLPIIATDQTGAEDLFDDGKEGWIVSTRNSTVIGERLQEFADSPALHDEMGFNARERAKLLGGWEKSGDRLVALLESTHHNWTTIGQTS